VTLTEKGVLMPGDASFATMFNEKIYHLADEESREKFIKEPKKYLPIEEPPQVRTKEIIIKL